jgi:hypothetical protein
MLPSRQSDSVCHSLAWCCVVCLGARACGVNVLFVWAVGAGRVAQLLALQRSVPGLDVLDLQGKVSLSVIVAWGRS